MRHDLASAVTEVTPNKFNERRVRVYRISCRYLARIFEGRVEIEGETLPADAEVGHVTADILYDGVAVYVFSNEFPPVPINLMIPEGGALGLRYYQYQPPADATGPVASWRNREPLL